jgi:hypothetical protein
MSGVSGPVRGQLADHFARPLLDHPWVGPESPSLLNTPGEIVGFHGSYARQVRLDGKPLRMA